MAEQKRESGGAGAEQGDLLTLTEVSKRTGISMPTLQKYKKQHAAQIPSVGEGRTQRYPEAALAVFRELRTQSVARRGRPRKAAAAAKRPARARKGAARTAKQAGRAEGGEGLLTLTQISKKTGISYPTLLRYVKTHLDKLPHVGSGRKRRFKPEAVEAFQQLYRKSRGGGRKAAAGKRQGARRGRPAGARKAARPAAKRATAAASPGAEVLTALRRLERRLAKLEAEVKKPLKVEIKRR